MQTTIQALQEIDLLAIGQQVAIKKSNEICITLANNTQTH